MSAVAIPPPPPASIPRGTRALIWPAPHHMRVIDEGSQAQPEQGLATLTDGEKLPGIVERIDFLEESLELRDESETLRVVPFLALRTLVLARPIEIERIPLAVPPGSVEALPMADTRKCVVEFKDKTTLEAEVVSVLRGGPGLFLYVPGEAGAVLRWFVPGAALASYRLGEPLGKALRERNALASEALEAGLEIQRKLQNTPIGSYFTDRGIVTSAQLDTALARQKTMSHLRLGDALVQEQLITTEQRDAALAAQAGDRSKLLGEILVEMGAVTREDIRHVLVQQLGVPSVALARFQYDANAVKAVSAELARKHVVMPLYRTSTRIAVGIENPLCWEALRELEAFTGLKVDPAMAAREDLVAAIAQFYGRDPATPEPVAALPASDDGVADADAAVVRLANAIIVDAFDQGASDIHIETMSRDRPSRVRLRIDGILVPHVEVPSALRAALVSRIKFMSELDIAERRRPQSGRIRFSDHGPRKVELSVVTIPTANGLEDVVMRILAVPRALTLDQLALPVRVLPELKAMAARSFGLLLVCGPTGSGKTTLLHSLLAHINTPQRKIFTVEDPIEISQDGLCQVQVNEKLGLTFPEVLNGFLRADPDVIMVGEMRDTETARIAVAAALTGHLVLSTMRSHSAVDSVVRLLDMGLDSFNFSDALIGVVGQRLVRRLCQECRTARVATDAEVSELALEFCRETQLEPATVVARWRTLHGKSDGTLTLYSPAGCPACERSGYKGRMGVFELLSASPAVKASIRFRSSSAQIMHEAADGGMATLVQDGIEKILRGHLDLAQVRQARP